MVPVLLITPSTLLTDAVIDNTAGRQIVDGSKITGDPILNRAAVGNK